MELIFLIIIIALITYIVLSKKKKKEQTKSIENPTEEAFSTSNKMPYRKKFLLSKNEWAFYKSLKPIADELGYTVLAKIRVADIVEVTAKDRSEWQTYFNKINKKHIDFVLARPENLKIELLIELDDNSHNEAQQKRDNFINELYKQTDYKFIRVRGTNNLKELIEEKLKEEITVQTEI